MRGVVDISKFWPAGKTVNAVHSAQSQTLGLNASTIKKAYAGELESIKVSNLLLLCELCSEWAGRIVTADEIVRDDDEVSL